MIRLTIVALAFLGVATSTAQSAPPVDYAVLAPIAVQRWQLAPGERVVMSWDRGSDRGVAGPLRPAIIAAGGAVEEIETSRRRSSTDMCRRSRRTFVPVAAFISPAALARRKPPMGGLE